MFGLDSIGMAMRAATPAITTIAINSSVVRLRLTAASMSGLFMMTAWRPHPR